MKRLWIFFLTVICLGQMMVAAGTTQAADWCEWNKNPDHVQATYQLNNQRLILLNKSREVVQVVEDHLILSDFYTVDYSPNCRYLVGALGKDGQFDTVIWDLESQPDGSAFLRNLINMVTASSGVRIAITRLLADESGTICSL